MLEVTCIMEPWNSSVGNTRSSYFSEGLQNKSSLTQAYLPYIFLSATVLSCFQTQEGIGEWTPLSAGLMQASRKGSLHPN